MATSGTTSSTSSTSLTTIDGDGKLRVNGRRTISPYDLTSSDNPGTVISKPLLRGPNYDEWAFNLRVALGSRKKFGFADGTIPQPDEIHPDCEDWIANNALVVSWIKLIIDESLTPTLSRTDNSHELWMHLQKRFAVKNGQRVQRLKTELANCRQKGLPIDTYFGKLTQLWKDMADYQQAKTMEEVQKEREEDRLHQFLMGLDESQYGAVKSAILSRVPLPSLAEAYHSVTQDEESKNVSRMNEERSEGVSFAVQTSSRPQSSLDNRTGSVTCSRCGRQGHLVENCFQRIGYPHCWPDKRMLKGGNNAMRGNSPSPGAGRGTTYVGSMKSKGTGSAHHVATANSSLNVSILPQASTSLIDADRVGLLV